MLCKNLISLRIPQASQLTEWGEMIYLAYKSYHYSYVQLLFCGMQIIVLHSIYVAV